MKKYTSIVMSVTVVVLGACASHTANLTASEVGAKDTYVSDVKDHLNSWEQRTNVMAANRASDLKEKIADARSQLTDVEKSQDSSWVNERNDVENKLQEIREEFGIAE